MTGNIEANRDIYANILNTGQIHDQRTLNLIIADLRQVAQLWQQPGLDSQAGREPLSLPAGWSEAMQLLARDQRAEASDRRRAYAAWLVLSEEIYSPQEQAARHHYIPLAGRVSLEDLPLNLTFSLRPAPGQRPDQPQQVRKLNDVTEAIAEHPAVVLLGGAGSGKSTVLRRLVLDTAKAHLAGPEPRLPLLVNLALYTGPEPAAFVRRAWRNAGLPDNFAAAIQAGQVLLLADGLNEMKRLAGAEQTRRATHWREFFKTYFGRADSRNRAIIASRGGADYVDPLNLPRAEIDPLAEAQIADFLQAYLGWPAGAVMDQLRHLALLEHAQNPYQLSILAALYRRRGADLPRNRGLLFAEYARSLLEREEDKSHAHWIRLEAQQAALARLGYALQERGESTARPAADLKALLPATVEIERQVVPIEAEHQFDLACRANLLRPIDAGQKVYQFSHQLLQEQFAAQHLLARWQAGEALADLWRIPRAPRDMPPAEAGPWDPLPPPPASGWEQPAILAAGITRQPDEFVRAVLAANPALAGRCLSEGGAEVNDETRSAVQQALLADLANPRLHRRTRLQAGQVLGQVGDPRFEPLTIDGVKVILPDLVEVAGGRATLGARRWPFDRQADRNERPQHRVELAPFYLARYPVTNAEYGCFIEAGGYDRERYWTPTGWQWRQGELEESGPVEELLSLYCYYQRNPGEIDKELKQERMQPDTADFLRTLIKIPEDEVRQLALEQYAPQPHEQPYYWEDPAYNAPNRPVVGVSWYEAMAYCAWLTERLGVREQRLEDSGAWPEAAKVFQSKIQNLKSKIEVRLPTEAEWEWAAGGQAHTRYPWGHQFDADKTNSLEGRVLGTNPVGAYPAGAAACGALDMAGNVWEWTHSLYQAYPYRPADGREDAQAAGRRVLRGGSWYSAGTLVRVSSRNHPS